MNTEPHGGAVGDGVRRTDPALNISFKSYLADRPAPTARLRAAELALDITVILTRPVKHVWPVFKNFNAWMSRFGFSWDRVPADNEDAYVHLGNKPGANDLGYGVDGARTTYIVRKVIPERLIYFDSLPLPVAGKDCVWTGHNLMTLHGEEDRTTVAIFMEHTWYSETMSIEDLRAEARSVLESGLAFWRDYFIADLMSALESYNPGTT